MPNLSKETIRKMRRVIEAVLANAKFYDQGIFPNRIDCGTTCCAAGFAVWLDVPLEEYEALVQRYGSTWTWEDLAKNKLGLQQNSYLFHSPNGWPFEFSELYYKAKTPKGRALALEACWEDFIDKDGVILYDEIPF